MKETMMLLVYILFTTVSPFALAISHAEEACRLEPVLSEPGIKRVDVYDYGRLISILGWSHASVDKKDHIKINDLLLKAKSLSEDKQCAEAENILSELRQSNERHFKSGQSLLTELLKIDKEIVVGTLAIEKSEDIWPQIFIRLNSQYKLLTAITNNCQNLQNRTLLLEVAKIAPGPEYLYLREKFKLIHVLPVEDTEAIKKTVELNEKLQSLPDITHQVKPEVIEYTKKLFNEDQIISDENIEWILSTQGEDSTTEVLRQSLQYLKEIQIELLPRNNVIVDKLMLTEGNIVFPVGRLHVTDIATKIYKRCKDKLLDAHALPKVGPHL